MPPINAEIITTVIVGLMSLVAVLVSVFKARAKQTTATAAALTELSDVSQDLRERVNRLEQENRTQRDVITDLQRQLAQIPILEAQVRLLSEELARVRLRHSTERDDLLTTIEQKDRELANLRRIVDAAGLTV